MKGKTANLKLRPLTKTHRRRRGYFVLVLWAVAPFAPAQGALTKPSKTKYPRRLVKLIFQKLNIKEIALAISTL
jgi:hypothetical protein